MASDARSRPWSVSLAAGLVLVSATMALGLAIAVYPQTLQDDEGQLLKGLDEAIVAVSLIVGVPAMLVGVGILRHWGWSRWAGSALAIVGLLVALAWVWEDYLSNLGGSASPRVEALLYGGLLGSASVIVLWGLLGRRADDWFF